MVLLEANPSMQTDLCGHEQEMSGYNAETMSVDLVVDGKVGHSCQYCHRQS